MEIPKCFLRTMVENMSVSFHIIMPHTLTHTNGYFPFTFTSNLYATYMLEVLPWISAQYIFHHLIREDLRSQEEFWTPTFLSQHLWNLESSTWGPMLPQWLHRVTASLQNMLLIFCFVLLRNILWLGTLFSNPTFRYILIISFWVNQNCIVAWYRGRF